jgi:rare lipoprotein A
MVRRGAAYALALAAALAWLPACAQEEAVPVLEQAAPVIDEAAPAVEEVAPVVHEPAADLQEEVGRGLASWYGPGFHGRRTASGERFDMHGLTAAHRTLPFGTVVRVQSQVNGRTVDVRINDRGPFLARRVIDLSRGAAEALGLIEARTGTKPVVLSVLKRAPY